MEHSPFASLSPEIRNEIYRLCFDHDRRFLRKYPHVGTRNCIDSIALTQICRYIRAECRAMFWAGRTISLSIAQERQVDQLCNFLRTLGKDTVQSLHALKLEMSGDHPRIPLDYIIIYIQQGQDEDAKPRDRSSEGFFQWVYTAKCMIIKTLAEMQIESSDISEARRLGILRSREGAET